MTSLGGSLSAVALTEKGRGEWNSCGVFGRSVSLRVDRKRTRANSTSTGCIEWFAPQLTEIARTAATPGSNLDRHISVFVTCLCNPEAVPSIPNMVVSIEKPNLHVLLDEFISPPQSRQSSVEDLEVKKGAEAPWSGEGGGVTVCSAGPENFTRESHNAVARISLTKSRRVGGISIHAETYAM